MKKISILIILIMSFGYSVQAQLYGYKWRLGVSGGTTNYFGDIRPMKLDSFKDFTKYYKRYDNYSERLSYQVSLEYALDNSIGLMFSAGTYQFGSSDRFVQNDGKLFTEGQNFDRALNFQTNLYDAGLSLVFKPDNNWLLSGKSFLAPYLLVGMGMQKFEVFGDLLDANDTRYDYMNTSVIPDGTFETNLSKLRTELPSGYDRTTLYAHLGIGIRFKITKTFELFAQSDFKMAATDYLDDVSGKYRNSYDNSFQEYAAKPGTNLIDVNSPYRGMKDGKNDWYIYHGIGIKFSFGANKTSFDPPVITQRYTYTPTELLTNQVVPKDTTVTEPIPEVKAQAGTVNNYFTIIQLPGSPPAASAQNKVVTDSATLVQIAEQKESLLSQRDQLIREIDSVDSTRAEYEGALELTRKDTTVSESITALRIQTIETEKSETDSTQAALSNKLAENQFKLDSLSSLTQLDSSMNSNVDTAAIMRELIIFPGQVSRILFNNTSATLSLDPVRDTAFVQTSAARTLVNQDSIQSKPPKSSSNTDSTAMSRRQFEQELDKFKTEMSSTQASRDSALMNSIAATMSREAFVTQSIIPAEYEGKVDKKTTKRINRNRIKQEQLKNKNNELLKDLLLVGGTAATTAAISNSGNKNEAAASVASDSTLKARIAMDSVIIDSLSNVVQVRDTVIITDTVRVTQEKKVETLLNQSKIEVYFDINSTSLNENEIAKLKPISDFMDTNKNVKIELIGFADNTGSISYNLKLTQKRVDEVLKVLTDQFNIAQDRIEQGNGGLIIRGNDKKSVEGDRKVEIRISNLPISENDK